MDSERTRRVVGVCLVVGALLLGGVGLFLWGFADTFTDGEPSRAPAIAAWAVGALVFLSGVIVLATAPLARRTD